MNDSLGRFFKGKGVFITGHTGFKGSWLSLWLQKLEAKVVGYALCPSSKPNLFELANVSDGMVSIIGDIRDHDKLFSVINDHKPEFIFHLAAQSLVRQSYLDPIDTYTTNVIGTVNLLEVVRYTPAVKVVVNVTSDKCYENNERVLGYRENDRLGGHDPYSSSKACAELVTSAFRESFFPKSEYKKHGVALASARAGNVIGGGDWAKDRLIPDCVRSFSEGEKVKIRYPESIRPWQHVLEPLGGYLLLAGMLHDNGPEYAGAWNFGPELSDEKPVRDIVDFIARSWGQNAQWEIDKKEQPHESGVLKLDTKKTIAQLGWKPCWNIYEALEETVRWYKDYEEKPQSAMENTLKQIVKYEDRLLAIDING